MIFKNYRVKLSFVKNDVVILLQVLVKASLSSL